MPSPVEKPALIVLVGPTAVGKTTASLNLAMRINGEIISADSRTFYRGMDIGTAKPAPEQLAQVPHHLIDFLDPDESYSLAEFQEAAHQHILAIRARRRPPLLVGGTGQYIRAITEGWKIPTLPPRPELRRALQRQAESTSNHALHRWLESLDPLSAKAIDPRNLRRTIRALEVIFTSGLPFSAQRRAGNPRYRCLILGLNRPRPELYARIDARLEAMLSGGFVDEVRGLLDAGYTPNLPSMSAIGYREICDHLTGQISLDDAAARIRKRTRTYVRRQANWFKPEDPHIHWFHPDDDIKPITEAFLANAF